MPTFSIITTAYKHEKFIAQTIESVLSQSLTDWELLIGDDSPDDATWAIIEQFMQKYPDKIKAWYHIPNKGIVDNMNFLLDQVSSESEFIAFLEGDDTYTNDCLEQKLSIFQCNSEVWVVYSDMDFIDSRGEVTLHWALRCQWVHMYQDEYISSDEYILARNPLIVSYSTIAMRKNVLMELIPIQNITWSKTYAVSDYDLIFRLIQKYKVYGIERPLTQYRRHSNNLSASYGWLFDDLLLLMTKYRDEKSISITLYQKKVSWIFILKSLASLASWDKHEARISFKKSLQEEILYAMIYKLVIGIFLILPKSFVCKILQKRLRRGS